MFIFYYFVFQITEKEFDQQFLPTDSEPEEETEEKKIKK
jgi:hypothetical protein